jgi:hypothetical protein
MGTTADPRGVRLQIDHHRSQIQRPPPPPAATTVIAGRPPPAPRATLPSRPGRTNPNRHHHLITVIALEVDRFDNGALDIEHPLPYPVL